MRCSPSAGDGARHFPGVFFEMPQRPRGRWPRLPSDGGGTQALGGWAAVWSPDAADSPPLEFPRPRSHLEALWGLPSALHEGIRAAPRSSAQAHAYVRRRTGAHAHARSHALIRKGETDTLVGQQGGSLPPTPSAENPALRKRLVLLASWELCDALTLTSLKHCLRWKLPYGYQGQPG